MGSCRNECRTNATASLVFEHGNHPHNSLAVGRYLGKSLNAKALKHLNAVVKSFIEKENGRPIVYGAAAVLLNAELVVELIPFDGLVHWCFST